MCTDGCAIKKRIYLVNSNSTKRYYTDGTRAIYFTSSGKTTVLGEWVFISLQSTRYSRRPIAAACITEFEHVWGQTNGRLDRSLTRRVHATVWKRKKYGSDRALTILGHSLSKRVVLVQNRTTLALTRAVTLHCRWRHFSDYSSVMYGASSPNNWFRRSATRSAWMCAYS